MTIRILFSAPYMIPVVDRFKPLFDAAGIELIIPRVTERMEEEELLQYAGQIDGAICGDDRYTRRVLSRAIPRLKVISKWGTGIDSIDSHAAQELGVRVCRTANAFTDSVSDSVLEYILMFARRGPWLDREMKAGRWQKIVGKALNECTLGVIGVGNIGKAVLRRAKPFGMQLLGNDIIEIDPDFIRETGVEMLPLPELLARADFISVNCVLTPESHHLIDEQALQTMRPQAVIINTARGPIISEPVLIRALQDGRIAGAALDVFEHEPLPLDSPLRSMDNVFLAPHNSNSSPRAWEHVHWNTLQNLFDGLNISMPDRSLVSD